MTSEIVEHACRILRGQPTRTLGARALHLRTCSALRADISQARFLELLRAKPELFTIVHDRALGDGWTAPERHGYAAALQRHGLGRGPTIVLNQRDLSDEPHAFAADDEVAALGASLSDAHAAVLQLYELEVSMGGEATTLSAAAVQLEELRIAYVNQLQQRAP